MVLEPAEEWQAMQPEVQATIKEVLGAGGGSEAEEEAEEESVAEGEGPPSICRRVCTLLKGAKYRQAVRLVLKAWEQLLDQAPFSMEGQEDDESEGTWPHEDRLLRVVEACFTGGPGGRARGWGLGEGRGWG
ncbi:hypothetical protein chiPu_0026520 [Chiloscyllium punctatum]|uniref:Uncharacterized protein n=1 Tax=Chiloscyllium punctatum TaxID=137246 RepID=A0A401TIX9_CHIPU|nr:hypothetical protein [Chiloscyllium punctatum]